MATCSPTSVRLPAEVHEQVDALARAERRSFTAQMVWLLEAGLTAVARTRLASLPPREQALVDELRDQLDAREVE
jgi:hypothetical protein